MARLLRARESVAAHHGDGQARREMGRGLSDYDNDWRADFW